MRYTFFALFITLLLPSLIFSQKRAIKSAEIRFNFVSKDVNGTLSGFNSSSRIDLENLAESEFEGSVSVATLKTGNFIRDWHLKKSKYFNADDYPKISFESTALSGTSNSFSVKGQLTLKGKTKSIAIDFNKKDDQLVGTTTLFSSDYGIHIYKERKDNEVVVKLIFELE